MEVNFKKVIQKIAPILIREAQHLKPKKIEEVLFLRIL
jgi:hypothetical protein